MLQWTGEPWVQVQSVDGPPDDMFFPAGRGDAIVVSSAFLDICEDTNASGLLSFDKVAFSGASGVLKRITMSYYRCNLKREGHIDYLKGNVLTSNQNICDFCGDDVASIASGVFMKARPDSDFFVPWNYNAPLCTSKMGVILSESALVLPRLCRGSVVRLT